MSVLVRDGWIDAPRGSFVLIPGGVTQDFENRSGQRAGVLNLSCPGPFEPHMPAIADWLVARDAEHAPWLDDLDTYVTHTRSFLKG